MLVKQVLWSKYYPVPAYFVKRLGSLTLDKIFDQNFNFFYFFRCDWNFSFWPKFHFFCFRIFCVKFQFLSNFFNQYFFRKISILQKNIFKQNLNFNQDES